MVGSSQSSDEEGIVAVPPRKKTPAPAKPPPKPEPIDHDRENEVIEAVADGAGAKRSRKPTVRIPFGPTYSFAVTPPCYTVFGFRPSEKGAEINEVTGERGYWKTLFYPVTLQEMIVTCFRRRFPRDRPENFEDLLAAVNRAEQELLDAVAKLGG